MLHPYTLATFIVCCCEFQDSMQRGHGGESAPHTNILAAKLHTITWLHPHQHHLQQNLHLWPLLGRHSVYKNVSGARSRHVCLYCTLLLVLNVSILNGSILLYASLNRHTLWKPQPLKCAAVGQGIVRCNHFTHVQQLPLELHMCHDAT